VEVGMGTPREAIDLFESDDGVPAGQARVHLLGVRSRTDWTDRMTTWSVERVQTFADLDGYVLKSDSPSCGLQGVHVYGSGGVARVGRGLFAEALVRWLPDLPVEEERRLHDQSLRENFLTRVLTYRRRRLAIPNPEPRTPNPEPR
jgi:uncharacterized protein YbbK (DUF523 family)